MIILCDEFAQSTARVKGNVTTHPVGIQPDTLITTPRVLSASTAASLPITPSLCASKDLLLLLVYDSRAG